jgi:proteasome lid subunit RPN8/RPN11
MVIRIARPKLDALIALATSSPDAEQCGLLFGARGEISNFRECANVSDNPAQAFELDPAALVAAHRAMREGGPQLIGHFHTHPNGRETPSATDQALSAGDGMIWLIITPTSVRGWHATSMGTLVPMALEIIDA